MKSLVVLALPVMLLGCGDKGTAPAPTAQTRRLGYDKNGTPSPVALQEVVVSGVADALPPVSVPELTNMVIRTGTASIEVDSLQSAVARLKQLAARVGGYVANSNIETGKSQLRQAELEVKIPATRFDEALSGLNPIGKLESVNVEAQDVGEEFVDVNARMENARRLERRLVDLLATRTVVGTAGKSVMGEAFAQAWRNLVAFVAFGIQALGLLLPLGLIAGLAWYLTRRLKVGSARTA